MRKAFTMIELIFVIVILGVLAAVAIPKLSATRTDAKIAKMAMAVGQSVSDIAAYAVSNANTNADLTTMSNTLNGLIHSGNGHKVNGEDIIVEIDDVDCIRLSRVINGQNDDINVSFVTTSDNGCLELQKRIDRTTYSIPLRGTTIEN
jgi:prepilin-type N-terminal cleavage/methylation domain-containing protein